MLRLIGIFAVFAIPALAETVVPTRTIRPNSVIRAEDVKIAAQETADGFSRLPDVVGQEARVALYVDRPIRLDDIGPPAIVARNQIVQIFFSSSALSISTEGRALERGAIGDRIRVMNLGSRSTVFGQVLQNGSVKVSR